MVLAGRNMWSDQPGDFIGSSTGEEHGGTINRDIAGGGESSRGADSVFTGIGWENSEGFHRLNIVRGVLSERECGQKCGRDLGGGPHAHGSVVKNLPANAGEVGSNPQLGRSPGEGNGNPLQYSFLGNPIDRGAWWATVHGVEKSQTQMSSWALRHAQVCPGQSEFVCRTSVNRSQHHLAVSWGSLVRG